MSEIRYDRLHDTHVIIAPERLHRPDGMDIKEKAADSTCPFCEGNESMTPPEIFALRSPGTFTNEPGWKTRVIPNLYKAVQIETPNTHHYGLFEYWEGFGAHEIIIDTPAHHTFMRDFSTAEIGAWLQTLRERVADLRRDSRIAYISLFKNEGTMAGSTQPHSHTQIIGLPIIPQAVREQYQRMHEHYRTTGKALLESIVSQEEDDRLRIIAKQGDFTAFCPYASAYPFEVMISSKKMLGQIDTLCDTTVEELAPLLLSILKKLKRQLGCFDYNLLIATPPLQGHIFDDLVMNSNETNRFSIRILPRIYRQGGFEAGTGIMINPVSPELAAKLLRESRDE